MDILSCAAIPIATVKITIAKMHKDGNNVIITDSESRDMGKPFWAPIPKNVASKLTEGDVVTIVCRPVSGFTFATETFAVKHVMDEGRTAMVLWSRDGYADYLRP